MRKRPITREATGKRKERIAETLLMENESGSQQQDCPTLLEPYLPMG
jgi:hypothetical protein